MIWSEYSSINTQLWHCWTKFVDSILHFWWREKATCSKSRKYNGLFPKIVPLMLRISIYFEVDPWISSRFYHDPLDFQSILSWPPGIFHFSFALTPLAFKLLSLYPLEFSLISSTGWLRFFFWKSPFAIMKLKMWPLLISGHWPQSSVVSAIWRVDCKTMITIFNTKIMYTVQTFLLAYNSRCVAWLLLYYC